ncbi:MAG: SagB/ThcOx family dehydrogenase [Firmicutes bacterium]|nr:SagB/ThcOx family dehydrogenase [Bacillota bacterium]
MWYRAFKKYPHCCRVVLEKPSPLPSPGLEEAVFRRRSIRDYSGQPLSLDEFGRVLFFSGGITGKIVSGDVTIPLRASASAGALYPIELYPVVVAVDSLEPGVYHYDVEGNALELLRPGHYRNHLFEDCHRQDMILNASAIIVMTAMFARTKIKYGERGYRYILLDAGHLAQNIYLECTALGLGCATVGGFMDDNVNRLIGVDGLQESAVYIAVIGKTAPGAGRRGCSDAICAEPGLPEG